MKTPFLKSLHGKFVLRTFLIALAVAAVVGGLAISRVRSLSSSADDAVATGSTEALEALANDVSSASSSLMMLVIVAALVMAIAAGAMAFFFARKVTTPIVLLRKATARSTAVLPEIAQAHAAGEEMPALPTIALSSGDELQDLADSIDYLQRTAAELSIVEPAAAPVAEAVAPQEVVNPLAEKLVDLGSRSHELLARQMKYIEAMEKDEANPANLQRLFQVDHLATRMRRNAESFLVLADKSSQRKLSRAVSMHQVVQAASSEIEHFERISLSGISGASVDGAVATDLAHLLAELLENATIYSSSEVMATVTGRPTDHGYLIDIIDHGTGMTPEEIDAANTRFAGGTTDVPAPEGVGHEVVARLAERHGVALKLSATPTGGLTAQVHIPTSALAPEASAQPTTIQTASPVAAVEPAVDPAVTHAAVADSAAAEYAVAETPGVDYTTDTLLTEPLADYTAPDALVSDALVSDALTEAPLTEPLTDYTAPDALVSEALTEAPLTEPLADYTAPDELIRDVAVADYVDPVAAPASETVMADSLEPVSGLTSEQQAAIDWAAEQGWGDASSTSTGLEVSPLLTATVANTELADGPVDHDTVL